MTAVAGATFSAAQFNQYVRDNLNETGPAKVTGAGQILVSTAANALAARVPSAAVVATSQGPGSTGAYVDLTTVGPTVTVNTGTQALVWIAALMSNSGANTDSTSVAVSGASSVAASDAWAAVQVGTSAARPGVGHLFTGLTPGSNIFTTKYKASGNTAAFSNREIIVVPL